MSLLIENGTVLTPGRAAAVLPNHSVLIENGCISGSRRKSQFRRFAGKRIDASRKVVLPGFINAHTHFYSTFARGLTKTKPAENFNGVLKNLWWRLDSALTTEDCYYSALIALLDSIRHGTTTIIDHHASPNAVRGSLAAIEKAVQETGLRACLCYEVSDRDGARIAKEGLEENVSFIRALPESRSSRAVFEQVNVQSPTPAQPVTAALFGLHASFTLSDATLEKAAASATNWEPASTSTSPRPQSDQEHSAATDGMRVVERLNKFGILGPQSIAAHCVHVNRRGNGPPGRDANRGRPQSAVQPEQRRGHRRRRRHEPAGRPGRPGHGRHDHQHAGGIARGRFGRSICAPKNPSVGFGEVVAALLFNNPKIAERCFDLPLGELREGVRRRRGDLRLRSAHAAGGRQHFRPPGLRHVPGGGGHDHRRRPGADGKQTPDAGHRRGRASTPARASWRRNLWKTT